MKDSKSLVSVFMAIGLALAVIVGIIVWKMSSPSATPDYSNQAVASDQDLQEATASSSTEDEWLTEDDSEIEENNRDASAAIPAPPSNSAGSGSQAASPQSEDPLMPPNAVVNTSPRKAAPTQVYRPSNIIPTTVAPGELAPLNPTEAPETGGNDQEPQPTSPRTTPVDQPVETQTPSPTTQPEQGGETNSGEANSQPTPSTAAEQGEQQAPEQQNQVPPENPVSWWNRVRGYLN